MAEPTNAGYQSVRDFLEANWSYTEVRDEAGNPIVRLADSDPRLTWTHDAGSNRLVRQTVIKGSDTDINADKNNPVDIRFTAFYDVATGGSVLLLSDHEDTYTARSPKDQITIEDILIVG